MCVGIPTTQIGMRLSNLGPGKGESLGTRLVIRY